MGAGLAVVGTALLLTGLLSIPSAAQTTPDTVDLGTVESYSVIGGSTVTNTGNSVLAGDVGVSPGSDLVGFPPGITLGDEHVTDAHAAQAQLDLATAYDDAAGRAPDDGVAGDIVGQTFTAGVYNSTSGLAVSGTVTLDGQGDPDSVFIFQIADDLIVASSSTINLVNDALPCNVFWQVGTSATLGTGSTFVGTIMALASISVTTGTAVEGRALARNGQVSLQNNAFTEPTCALATPPTTTTPTATTPPGDGTPPPGEGAPPGDDTPPDASAPPELVRTGAGPFVSLLLVLGGGLLAASALLLFAGGPARALRRARRDDRVL